MPWVLGVAEPKPGDGYPTVMLVQPELGFAKGNVMFVSRRAATIAEAGTPSELRLVANFLNRHRASADELRATAADLRRTADEFERLADEKSTSPDN